MPPEWQIAVTQLQQSVGWSEPTSAAKLAVYLLLGGTLSLYLRWLFRRCSGTLSNSEDVTRVFPLLTVITTAVIVVVKSSLALSLGMVGALSIVRFRSAIKEPEELVYLFLCVAVGLALGAEQPALACTLVAVASLFTVGMRLFHSRATRENVLLTITGDAEPYFSGEASDALRVVQKIAGRYALQRLDLEQGRGQLRCILPRARGADSVTLLARLRSELPGCEVSYVCLNELR